MSTLLFCVNQHQTFYYTLPEGWFHSPNPEIVMGDPVGWLLDVFFFGLLVVWVVIQLCRTRSTLERLRDKKKWVSLGIEIVLRVYVVLYLSWFIYKWADWQIFFIQGGLEMHRSMFFY